MKLFHKLMQTQAVSCNNLLGSVLQCYAMIHSCFTRSESVFLFSSLLRVHYNLCISFPEQNIHYKCVSNAFSKRAAQLVGFFRLSSSGAARAGSGLNKCSAIEKLSKISLPITISVKVPLKSLTEWMVV